MNKKDLQKLKIIYKNTEEIEGLARKNTKSKKHKKKSNNRKRHELFLKIDETKIVEN